MQVDYSLSGFLCVSILKGTKTILRKSIGTCIFNQLVKSFHLKFENKCLYVNLSVTPHLSIDKKINELIKRLGMVRLLSITDLLQYLNRSRFIAYFGQVIYNSR